MGNGKNLPQHETTDPTRNLMLDASTEKNCAAKVQTTKTSVRREFFIRPQFICPTNRPSKRLHPNVGPKPSLNCVQLEIYHALKETSYP
jgi:hypothetical protein